MDKYCIGIDLGGTTAKFGLFNDKDTLLFSFQMPSLFIEKSPEKVLIDKMVAAIRENVYNFDNKIKLNQIKKIGIGIPGPAINDKYVVNAVNLNWNKKFNIENEFRKRLYKNIEVKVNNDANIAALGEYYFGSGKNKKSICLIIIGTGIGMGTVIDGKIIEGHIGQAGEIGHIKVDNSQNAIKCNCGNIGCLETVASGKGIVNVYNRMFNDSVNSADEIFNKAKNGDKNCIKSLDVSLSYLAKVIVDIERIINPDCFIIGGGVSNAGKYLIDKLNSLILDMSIKTWKKPIIKLAKLKNRAGIYGAYSLFK